MTQNELFDKGCARVRLFCKTNNLPSVCIENYDKNDWHVDACAYYRRFVREGKIHLIRICIPRCAKPATGPPSRNWNWPGSTTDREPFGVLCHELGHHVDCCMGMETKLAIVGNYSSSYSETVMNESGEKPLTSYCPNPAEWFAEMFRLFVTNAKLLECVRPKTFRLFTDNWAFVSHPDWKEELGSDCPRRILKALANKGAK